MREFHQQDGSLLVQLRDKSASIDSLIPTARAFRTITKDVGARFVINAWNNAFVDIAYDVGADGAHVPCTLHAIQYVKSMWATPALGGAHVAWTPPWISTPAHTDSDVEVALDAGADAVLVSPIWKAVDLASGSAKGTPRGPQALTDARTIADSRKLSLAVYALGGVDVTHVEEAKRAGADGVAVIRALLSRSTSSVSDLIEVTRELDAPFHPPD